MVKEYLTKNNSKVYLVQDIPVDRESGQPKYNVMGAQKYGEITVMLPAKAQMILEKRKKNLANKGKKGAGKMDSEGRKGSNAKTASEKAFEEKNKQIKSETTTKGSGEKHQGVKGASKTISTKGAKKGTTGSKNKADYQKEARDKRLAELKAKANKQT